MEVYVDDEAKLTLHGLQQHYVKLKDQEKNRKLFELLDVLEFNQVVIFVKSVQRCMALAQLLIEQNFPAIGKKHALKKYDQLALNTSRHARPKGSDCPVFASYQMWFAKNYSKTPKITLKYRIRLIATPGLYFSKWIFGWGSVQKIL